MTVNCPLQEVEAQIRELEAEIAELKVQDHPFTIGRIYDNEKKVNTSTN